ncbi:hypothetical protein OH809_05335 [Streptomyces sp. NBC_00873]|uniref:hypothetical protein n=1 Tax=unclassified Streptomyces TaxID=2593676 RepID=UPI00386587DD|nr:hypothetical protein OH809_05335 [Streptomyces sp. NBC_00873]WTA47752.1 hypothetical protein OH821_38435 [Streptomyces sp. NBC_00842]WTE37284.1 hypothetical protein OH735_31875 [Streptomyces sp. NBC_01618]
MLITAGACVALLTACTPTTANTESGPGSAEDAAICPVPSPAANISDLPSGFKVGDLGVVTTVRKQHDFTSMVISTRESIREAFGHVHKLADQAGFTVLSSQNDGIDAEIFVKTPHGQGFVGMSEGSCGQVIAIVELPEPPK